jgi:hypothetical protein
VHLTGEGGELEARALADVDARDVLLVEISGHPHGREIRDLEQHRPRLNRHADDRVLRDHVTLDGRTDRDRLGGFAGLDDLVDILGRDAEQLEPATRVLLQAGHG